MNRRTFITTALSLTALCRPRREVAQVVDVDRAKGKGFTYPFPFDTIPPCATRVCVTAVYDNPHTVRATCYFMDRDGKWVPWQRIVDKSAKDVDSYT